MERAHPRSGDNYTPDMIVGAVTHPDTPHAAAFTSTAALIGYTER
ncbi:hypothetical protein STENM223S_00213 [Streptomyces tendae]